MPFDRPPDDLHGGQSGYRTDRPGVYRVNYRAKLDLDSREGVGPGPGRVVIRGNSSGINKSDEKEDFSDVRRRQASKATSKPMGCN